MAASVLSLLVLLLVAGLYVWLREEEKRPDSTRPRIAVLPFANDSGDPSEEYFADGMTEQLISTLSKVAGLEVIGRTSAMRYKRARRDIPEIGRKLRVGTVLEGGVSKEQDKVRVTARLRDVREETPLWSEQYDRELKDVFSIQRAIAQRVTEALKIRLTDDERRRIEARGAEDLEAYTLYLKGRYHWNQRTRRGFRQAIEYFERAIGRDPNDAAPYAGLADSYAFLGLYGYLPGTETFPKATAAAVRALEIDETRADAHASLAVARMRYEWDWVGAEKGLQRALALDPSHAPAHEYLGYYFVATGRFEHGIAEMKRALELDPLALTIHSLLGWAYYYARQYDRAIEEYRKTLDIEPRLSLSRWGLGVAYALKGMYREAIPEIQLVVKSRPDVAGDLGYIYAKSGQTRDAHSVLAKLHARAKREYVSPLAFAWIYIGLRQTDKALASVEKAYAERNSDLIYIKVDPYYDPLRSDPRFTALVKRIGLEK